MSALLCTAIVALTASIPGATEAPPNEPTYGVEVQFSSDDEAGTYVFTAVVSENESRRVLAAPRATGVVGKPMKTSTSVADSGLQIDMSALTTDDTSFYEVVISNNGRVLAIHKGTLTE